MNSLRKIFRRIRTLLWTTLTLLTLLAAVVVGIGKLLMPYSVHYQPELEAWLSKAFNQTVKVESFSGEWKAFGPRISLQGVTLMPDGMESEIAINRAALDIKPLNYLIPGRPLYSFRIIGADLALERMLDGRYILSGLGVSNTGSGQSRNSGLRDVALNGEVRLQDVSLSFNDPEREIHLVLSNVNGRLKMDGRNMAAEIQARVTDRERRRVVGDLDAIVQIRLDTEQHLEKASWHIKTGELMLAELVRQLPHHPLLPTSGRLNGELWGQWQLGSPQEMQGVVDLREALLSSQEGPLLIDHLNSRLNFSFIQRKNWRMDLAGLVVEYAGSEWESERLTVARNIPQNLGLWVSADYVELDMPLQLTQRIMATYNTSWPAAIPKRGQGIVTDFDLVLDAGWQLSAAIGQLQNGHFWGWEKGPDIEGIDAQFDLGARSGDIGFAGPSVKLDWPRVFRRPLTFTLTACRLETLWTKKTYWQFDLNRCQAQNEDMSVSGRVRMASSEGKPEIDINAAMQRGDVSRFGDYWPENVMKARTLHWLRTSLVDGLVSNGRYSMTGDMDNFPFTDQSGRLIAVAPVENAVLKYVDGWPRASQVTAVATFEGPGMYVEGRIGQSAGATVDNVSARIADFKSPVLDLEYETATELPALISFLERTPLLNGLDLNLNQFVFTGPADINGQLRTGLGESTEPIQVSGSLQFEDNQFTELRSGVVLEGVAGTLEYHREGLEAKQLSGSYKGFPVELEVFSDWDADEVFRASLHGSMPVEKVIPEDLLQREPLFHRASGTSQWDIGISVISVDDSDRRETWLDIYSGLGGVSIDLPAPFGKPAEESWPMLVRYPIRTENNILTADVPGRMQFKMELTEEDAKPLRGAVQLDGKVKTLPPGGTFVVNGSTPIFDLDGWIDLTIDRLSETEDVGGLTLQTASVNAGEIMIFNRRFEEVGLRMLYEDGVITGNFDSQGIDGTVRYYKNEEGSHSMTGEFERLILPDPVAEGMTMESNPADLPEMHFFSKEFSYLGLDLGETRIEGYPVENGFHIESIEAHSPSLIFNARGDWLRTDEGEQSDFDIRITSESLGTVLEAMDISSAMQGGQTLVHFDAWWEGPPAAFALASLNGDMDISVIQGNILTADPGAGRMLGLLSLSELPRRLAMDFRDVFNEGFSFDEAKGTMKLENGTSYTDDLVLSSTAAEISIVGSTDLVAKTFDYEVAVRPGVSKTLPVIGAIAGGPAGAAAGLALQALLRDALGEAAEARYTIRGPWEDSEVERVERPPRQQDSEGNPDSGLPAETGSEKPVEEQIEDQPPDQPGKGTETGLTGGQITEEKTHD
jgi:uncharacterized protein (TIGR02099 family)